MAIRSKNKVSTNFNMSSMTDIVFLLLIFFVITSTLISPNALKLLLPKSSSKTLSKQTVSVSITKDFQYFINQDAVSFDQIEPNLKQMLVGEVDPGIILHVEKSVPIEEAVKVMDIANRNKYKLVLATAPQ
ncbi:biopolymer transporter ExbD [Vicingus serpentipes]|jgi:biopolymer transport protein ExbD|uniref:Biopolymer transporter ExbD n=1 Tax=Vicingus serpentipes TaxID=1926625 RepID=A0A5C6RP71_9FLAO|nr:biopolymer transporter ExbD [Vicingus serpentipes]TXB64023.1 biopolymer transporter ExbD [Vicingus serpentipes]